MTEQPNDPYGQPQPYGQPSYGQQPQYPAAPYGQQQPMPYGPSGTPQPYGPYSGGRPAKPGGVVTAAVFGFIFGALGVLSTIGLIAGGAVGASFFNALAGDTEGSRAGARFFTGVFVALGLLALAWTVLMIWGSVNALIGRSRVLLIIGGSIAIATTALYFFVALANISDAGAGPVIFGLIFVVVSILIVVLVANRAASQFFAAHRALRGR
jgi:hypothetical protein